MEPKTPRKCEASIRKERLVLSKWTENQKIPSDFQLSNKRVYKIKFSINRFDLGFKRKRNERTENYYRVDHGYLSGEE